jgi:ribulose-5-phosphate 4-epimerase/fuculose-1-phosphate aldolase
MTTPFAGMVELNEHRRKLQQLGLIGVDASGIGFGNLSIRDGTTNKFYITGSMTGGKPALDLADYARVVSYDFGRNWLRCEGSNIASSESLTHAAIYESEPKAGAVIHCHDLKLWQERPVDIPATPEAADYGTPEMVQEVRRLFENTDVKSRKIFMMAGHEGGFVAFGKDLEDAYAVLMKHLEA